MIAKIFTSEYMNIGSGIQPFNAWLLIRGLRTLPARLEQITRTTYQVVEFLKQQERVELVIFPFDKHFPQYELAVHQMKDACGLLTFVLRAENISQIERFCESLQHILMAVSWGGHESLIIPRCAGMNKDDFDVHNSAHRMIRLYCGLEEANYLIKDLEQAFAKMD